MQDALQSPMKLMPLLISAGLVSAALADDPALNIQRDIPYAEPADPLQVLDVYSPPRAKNLPVIVWIHGGGWQQGDKKDVEVKPQAFVKSGFVFVSVNY